MKLIGLLIAFCLSSAQASTSISVSETVALIKKEFLGYNFFQGISNDGKKCTISIANAEGGFAGVQVYLYDQNNHKTAVVSIDSTALKVTTQTFKKSNQIVNLYEIYDADAQDSSLIAISHHEDVSDFDLVLTPSVLKNRHYSCSYSE